MPKTKRYTLGLFRWDRHYLRCYFSTLKGAVNHKKYGRMPAHVQNHPRF